MFKFVKTVFIALIFSAVIFTGCKKNKAPDKPSTPVGPTKGSIDTEYTFASSAEDPEDDDVAIRFAWGDGDTSDWSDWQASGDSISMSHSWSDSGSYTIRAQAQDLNEATSSWSSSHKITIGATIANNPPNTPTTPIGDSIGSINVSYSFISTAIDPDSDSIAIRFDWGDGDTSDWSSFAPSGDSVSMSHSWSNTGTYNIKAQAKDKKDTTSTWSSGHSIKISGGGWIKTFGGSSLDGDSSVDVTSDGGYIITGNTHSYGTGGDVYLIKTDAMGNQTWYKTFGSSGLDYGESVQQTTDGGYIITGYTELNDPDGDVYIIKTDANGNQDWYRYRGGTGKDYGNSVQQTIDGGYIIVGTTPYQGNDAIYLIKIKDNGDPDWAKHKGFDESDDFGYSVQQTTDGGYILVGETYKYGNGNVFLQKVDTNGVTDWWKDYGGTDSDWGNSVQQTSDGGYIITGSTCSYGAGRFDVYLIKTNDTGAVSWTKTFGGSNDDFGYSVQQTTDGGYIITGNTRSYGAGGADVWLIKTDANGNGLWENTFGGSDDDYGYSVRRHYDSYIITGSTWSYGAGGSDVYLIKTDANGNVE